MNISGIAKSLGKTMRAYLFMSYLKDQCECLLRVEGGVRGTAWYFRRIPHDSAGPERIRAFLQRGGTHGRQLAIHVLLLPPEIHTTSSYLPIDINPRTMRQMLCSELLPTLPYPDAYDLQNYPLSQYPNGHGDQLVITSLMGRAVLAGVNRVLGNLCERVQFIGDGLQFLPRPERCGSRSSQTYQLILPWGERFYIAGFSMGSHTASFSLSNDSQHPLKSRHFRDLNTYLGIQNRSDAMGTPNFITLTPPDEWRGLGLPRAAYPLWYLARNAIGGSGELNHVLSLKHLWHQQAICQDQPRSACHDHHILN